MAAFLFVFFKTIHHGLTVLIWALAWNGGLGGGLNPSVLFVILHLFLLIFRGSILIS